MSRVDPRNYAMPDPVALGGWLSRANTRLDSELSRFDALLLRGDDIEDASRDVLSSFMAWCRASVAPFATSSGAALVSSAWKRDDQEHWSRAATSAARASVLDPGTVERFLRVWLAAVHEATASGYASLFA